MFQLLDRNHKSIWKLAAWLPVVIAISLLFTYLAVRAASPIATDNTYTTDEDVPVSGNVITDDTGDGVDSDPDGDPLTAALSTDVSSGTLVLNSDGNFVYTPTTDFNGVDSFIYQLLDDTAAVGYWSFDDGTDPTADRSGNGHAGDLVNGPSFTTTVPPSLTTGLALAFDGVDDYVSIGGAESDFDLNQLSVLFWMKTDGFIQYFEALVTKGDSAWRVHRYATTGQVSFGTNDITAGDNDMPSNASVDDGQWHHIAAVYDGSAKYLYIDGALDNSEAASGTIATNDFSVLIGENDEAAGRYFGGLMDDVQVYDWALSASEVVDAMTGPFGLDSATVVITVNAVNDSPIFSSTPLMVATVEQPYTYTVNATDPDIGDVLTITSSIVPSWLSLTDHGDGTATLSGTPAISDIGEHAVTLQVVDNVAAMDTQTFTVTVSSASVCSVYTSADTPLSLLDPGTITSTLTVMDVFTIGDVNVTLNLSHTYDSDLMVTLIAPDDTSVLLFSGVGGDGDDFAGTVLDDEAATDITAGSAPFTGSFRPVEALSNLDGISSAGDWRLVVLDNVSFDTGTLQNWQLELCSVAAAPPAFVSTPVLTATEDVTYTYVVTATDLNSGDALTLSALTGPFWLTLNDNLLGFDPVTSTGQIITATLAGVSGDYDTGDHPVTLQVQDSAGLTTTQNFTLSVANTNDAPVFESTPIQDALTNITYTYSITATDMDGDPLSLSAPTLPAWASFAAEGNGGGIITGTPTFADIGQYPVVLELQETVGFSFFNYVYQPFTITVANDPPSAYMDTYTVLEDSSANVLDVLTNDEDYPESLSLTALGTPQHGTASISGTTVLYTPATDYFGPDSVRYSVSDGHDTSEAVAYITVEAVNDYPPQAVDDLVTVYEDAGGHQLYILNNDTETEGDSLYLTAVGAAQHGLVSIQYITSTVIYTPELNYNGPDVFTYTVSDGDFFDTASVIVTVNPVNDPPVAVADVFTVTEDSQANPLAVLLNDSDVDGDILTLTGVGQPLNGSAVFEPHSEITTTPPITIFTVITYTPDVNFVGSETFSYTVSDGLVEAESSVTVVVLSGNNDTPEAQNDLFSVAGDAQDERLPVLDNDRDPEGDALSLSIATSPAHGNASVAPDGQALQYTPQVDFSGDDSLVYALSDGNSSMTATVRIRVLAANKPPLAVDDAARVDAGTQDNALTVLANDSDPDDNRLTLAAVGTPSQAGSQVTFNPLRTALLYTPAPGFDGTDTFTYTVTDGHRQATATVNVTVNGNTTEADLSLTRSVAPTALYAGEAQAVTVIYTVTNTGPSVATGVTVQDAWSVAPAFAAVVSGGSCTGNGMTMNCQLADLPAGASATLVQNVRLQAAAGTVTAQATVATAKTDPAAGNNQAAATLTVNTARTSRTLGALTIVADSFSDQGGGVTRATGNVGIGAHFYLAGASSTLDFDADNILAASGELRMRMGDYALFNGAFTANGATGAGAPGAGVSYAPLTHVAGFAVTGAPAISQLNFLTGYITGTATLAYQGGDAHADAPVAFTASPGPHFAGSAGAPFDVLYGAGDVLRLRAETATLAKEPAGYTLLAQGVLTYNLTHPLTETAILTTPVPGIYDRIPSVRFKLGASGDLAERETPLPALELAVDYLTLRLEPVALDNRGLYGPGAALRVADALGGASLYRYNVYVTKDGLSLGGQLIQLPDIVPPDALFAIRQPVALIMAGPAGYTLSDFKASLALDMAQNHSTFVDFKLGPAALQPVDGGAAVQSMAPAAPNNVNQNLTAYFPFDQVDRSSDFDNKAASFSNCILYDQDNLPVTNGYIGKAVFFDGNDYLHGDNENLLAECGIDTQSDAAQFTIAFWFKTEPQSAPQALIANQDWTDEKGFVIGCRSRRLVVERGTGSIRYSIGADGVCDGQWHHVAIRAFPSGWENPQVKYINLYVDGKFISTNPVGVETFYSGKPLYVGAEANEGFKFHGLIDDLRLYNRAIPESQVAELASMNPAVALNVANAGAALNGASVSGGCLEAGNVNWTMPDILGGGARVVYNPNPLCSSEISIDTSAFASLEFGTGSKKAGFEVTQVTLRKSGDELFLKLEGSITFTLETGGQSASATGYIEMGSNNQVGGEISAFEFTLVGFTAGVENAKVNNGTFTADTVSLKVGSPFPPAEGEIRGVTFTPPRDISITGGGFTLPELGAGKFKMSLSGNLDKKSDGSYEITAAGSFPIPSIGTLAAEVVLVKGPSGQVLGLYAIPYDPATGAWLQTTNSTEPVVIPLDPVPLAQALAVGGQEEIVLTSAASPLALQSPAAKVALKSISLALEDAAIPVGNTGVYITELGGKVTLYPGNSQKEIEIWTTLQYGKEWPLISADLRAKLAIDVPYFRVKGTSTFNHTRVRTRELWDDGIGNLYLPYNFQTTQPLLPPNGYSRYTLIDDDTPSSIAMNQGVWGGAGTWVFIHEPFPGEVSYSDNSDAYDIRDWTGKAHITFDRPLDRWTGTFNNPRQAQTINHNYSVSVPVPKLEPLYTHFVNLFAFFEAGQFDRTNVAYGKAARQSSTAHEGSAGRAVDGNANGWMEKGSVTHTDDTRSDEYDWWEVDLGAVYTIAEIKIWNRTDGYQARLAGIVVMVSDTPFDQSRWAKPGDAHPDWSVRYSGYHKWDGLAAADVLSYQPNTRGRYVRIQKLDNRSSAVLSLAEVAVYVNQSGWGNVSTFTTGENVVACRPPSTAEASVTGYRNSGPRDVCVLDWYETTRNDSYTLQRRDTPWIFSFGGEVSALDELIKIGEGNLIIDYHNGVDAALHANTIPVGVGSIIDFNGEVSAWKDNRGFNMAGTVGFDFGISLESLTCGKITVGPKMEIGVGAEFGKFYKSSQAYWGAKMDMSYNIPDSIDWMPGVPDKLRIRGFAGYGNGMTFAFGSGTKAYSLVQRTQVLQALAARDQLAAIRASGVLGATDTRYMPLNINDTLHFTPTAPTDVAVDVAVGYNTNTVAYLQTSNPAITMTLTAPDGAVYETAGSYPGGVTFESYTFAQPQGGTSLRAQQGQAGLRAVHAVVGAPALDLWADNGTDTLIFSSLVFSDTTVYHDMAPGAYTLRFREAGTANVLAQTTVTLNAGDDLTVLAAGAPGSLYAWAVPDNNAPRGDLMDTYLRVIHAAPTLPNMTVGQVFGTGLFVDLGYGVASDYRGLMAQRYDLEFLDAATGDWLLDYNGSEVLEPNSTYTLFIFETTAGDLAVKLVQDAAPVAQVRFLHATSSYGSVDLTADGQPVHSAVAPLTLSGAHSLPLGDYEMAVMQGASTLVTATVPITYNLDYVLALVEESSAPMLKVITDTNDVAPLEATGQMRVVHLAPTVAALEATAVSSDSLTTILSTGLSYGAAGEYQMAGTGLYTLTVSEAGGSVLLSAPNLPLDAGATTLYLVDDGGSLALVGAQDATVEWLRTDRVSIEDAQTGNWQVTLHNALASAEDYTLEVSGALPETTLSDPDLIVGSETATVTWALNSFEPDNSVELRLGQLSWTPAVSATEESIITETQVITLSSGLTETVVTSSTVNTAPTPLTFRTLDVLTNTNDPGWIDGTPQSYAFDYTDLPNGVYELQLRVDDYVHPIVTHLFTTTFAVEHPWPASWAANPQITRNVYGEMTVAWDALDMVNLDSYELRVNASGIANTSIYTLNNATTAYTLTNILPDRAYTVMVLGYDFQTGDYSMGGSTSTQSAVADFALTQMTALPALDSGTAASVVVSVTSDVADYPGAVKLIPDGYADGIGLRVEPDVVTPTAQGVAVTVWISASEFIANGAYTATLRGIGGGTVHTLDFAPDVIVPYFDITPVNAALTLTPAGASLVLAATGYNGHSGDIQLDLLNVPLGVQAAFDDNTLIAGQTTRLRLSGTPLAQRGVYTFTLRADDGPNRQTIPVTLTVVAPDFTVTPQVTQQVVTATQTAQFTLDVALLDGWDAPVTLRVDPASAPSGGTVALQTTGALAHSVTLSSDGTATLVVNTTTATPGGLYVLAVTAESAGETRIVEVELTVAPSGQVPGSENFTIFLPLVLRNYISE
ncbi:MAG: tandem-95 repeat protein [Anaerolineae bacterium]|nr:tandem-95 repeat protein [Anaerolineae bacterium]